MGRVALVGDGVSFCAQVQKLLPAISSLLTNALAMVGKLQRGGRVSEVDWENVRADVHVCVEVGMRFT
jgi:hypothetical protein